VSRYKTVQKQEIIDGPSNAISHWSCAGVGLSLAEFRDAPSVVALAWSDENKVGTTSSVLEMPNKIEVAFAICVLRKAEKRKTED
jgi:hypothetical protein